MVSVNFATILTYIAFQRILPTIFVYYAIFYAFAIGTFQVHFLQQILFPAMSPSPAMLLRHRRIQ